MYKRILYEEFVKKDIPKRTINETAKYDKNSWNSYLEKVNKRVNRLHNGINNIDAASIILILIGMLFFVGVLINGIRLLNKPYMSEFYVQPLIICVVCSVIFCGIGGFIKKI